MAGSGLGTYATFNIQSYKPACDADCAMNATTLLPPVSPVAVAFYGYAHPISILSIMNACFYALV